MADYGAILEVARAAALAGGDLLREYFDPSGRAGALKVESKARNDLVSQADRESEEVIALLIQEAFPNHVVLGEEAGIRGAVGSSQRVGAGEFDWIVDPLDGTMNFVEGLPIWSVSVACRHRGRLVAGVVYEPWLDNWFSAAVGEEPLARLRGSDQPLEVSPKTEIEDAFLATGFPFKAQGALDVFLAIFRDTFPQVRSIRRCGSAAIDLAYVAAGIYDGFWEFRLSAWDIAAGALLIEQAGGVVTDLDGGDHYLESGNIVAATKAVHPQLLAWVREHANEALLDELAPL